MWGCDYLPFFGEWRNGFFPGGVFAMLTCLLVVVLLIYGASRVFSSLSRHPDISSRDRSDSLEILKARFAHGEVSPAEYVKLKEILSRP